MPPRASSLRFGHEGPGFSRSDIPFVSSRADSCTPDCDGVTVPSVLLAPLIAEQWRLIEAYRQGRRRAASRGGRPRTDDRECFEAVLWVILSGVAGRGWKNLPARFPSPATCWRRLAEWRTGGVWLDRLWHAVRPPEPFPTGTRGGRLGKIRRSRLAR
ncbi:transposase [Anaeromyxobacter terrae]|uniref:transposase n=1 Tax=Anaeromyxobacter terrae TaxID=2925406 RepID=UPI0038CBFAC2